MENGVDRHLKGRGTPRDPVGDGVAAPGLPQDLLLPAPAGARHGASGVAGFPCRRQGAEASLAGPWERQGASVAAGRRQGDSELAGP